MLRRQARHRQALAFRKKTCQSALRRRRQIANRAFVPHTISVRLPPAFLFRFLLILQLLSILNPLALAQKHSAAAQKPAAKAQPSPKPEDSAADEYAVYATAISGLYDNAGFKDRKLLIENRTVSFECGSNSCNQLDVADGCSGMRQPGQEPEQVLPLFRNTMSLLQEPTWNDFRQENEHCATLKNDFPLQRDYLWMDDATRQAMIGKKPAAEFSDDQQAGWSQPDKVFLSKPGFNPDHTQSLLYLAVVCHGQCQWMGYLLLGKVNGQWTAVGHYTVAGQ